MLRARIVDTKELPGQGTAVTCGLELAGSTYKVNYHFPAGPLDLAGNALLAMAILPAMQAGDDLEIEGPVSPQLLEGAATIQDIFHTWDSRFKRVKISAGSGGLDGPPPATPPKTALFFSGGLDSFYTLLKRESKIDSLIYVNGFDIKLDNTELYQEVVSHIGEVADRLGKESLIVSTDLRQYFNYYNDWILMHGAGLVSVAHFLAPRFPRIYIAASNSYLNLIALGTHPVLDPLWGTGRQTFIHDGAEATRFQKLEFIIGANPELVLDHLRVCWENSANAYNCGRCRKCLQTMLTLRVLGVLDRSRTFTGPLDLADIASMTLTNPLARSNMAENLLYAEQKGTDPEVIAAIRQCLAQATPVTALHESVSHVAELRELQAEVAYYKNALRFQLAERLNTLLLKNKVGYRLAGRLAHRLKQALK